jgi:hypothetical protein
VGHRTVHPRRGLLVDLHPLRDPRPEPFACSWLIEGEDRSDRVVLEANRDHWNKQRGPRLERVVFRNDLSPEEALDACVSGDGEVDIVTEVSPADAARVRSSKHAELVEYDANRVLVGVVNRYESPGAPLGDKRARGRRSTSPWIRSGCSRRDSAATRTRCAR